MGEMSGENVQKGSLFSLQESARLAFFGACFGFSSSFASSHFHICPNEVTMTEQQVITWLLERDNFLLLTHVRPDGDTLGSASALCRSLNKAGKAAYLLRNPGVTRTFDGWLTLPWAPDGWEPEHVIAVDIATEKLFPDGEQQKYLGKTELCIDHHPSNEHYAQNLCLDPEAAAAGEVVYTICKGLGNLDEEMAKALYIAISTDCGCFVYSNTRPQSHRIAAELMELADMSAINKHFFQTKSSKELGLQARLMNSLAFFEDGKVCIGTVTVADKAALNADESDCEELSSFAATIEGVLCAATIRELEPNQCKVSLRTTPSYANANHICNRMGGGGHPAASGATLPYPTTVEEARKIVYQAIFHIIKGEALASNP